MAIKTILANRFDPASYNHADPSRDALQHACLVEWPETAFQDVANAIIEIAGDSTLIPPEG